MLILVVTSNHANTNTLRSPCPPCLWSTPSGGQRPEKTLPTASSSSLEVSSSKSPHSWPRLPHLTLTYQVVVVAAVEAVVAEAATSPKIKVTPSCPSPTWRLLGSRLSWLSRTSGTRRARCPVKTILFGTARTPSSYRWSSLDATAMTSLKVRSD